MTIGLGDLVKDKITGFEGVVTSRTEHLYNGPRYHVQPRLLKDGKPVEGRTYDEAAIDVVERAVRRVVPFSRPAKPVGLGDVVRDPMTGLEGTTIAVAAFIDGCVRIGIQPAILKDGLPVDPSWLDEYDAEIVASSTIPEREQKTGGPSVEARRR